MNEPKYKIHVHDRNYSSCEIFDTIHFTKIEHVIDPLEYKLFTNDVFTVDNANNKVNIIHSSIRSGPSIPGVLILTGNKTYGRENQNHNKNPNKNQINEGLIKKPNNSKNSRLLYKCIPDDMRLPCFLIPYELKNVGFSKVLKNMYVTFHFDSWDDKHPKGKLDNVIGSVDILDNFYEYQLYCKSLNASIQKFQKDTTKALENSCHSNKNKNMGNSHDSIFDTIKTKYKNIEDRTDQKKWHIITIDPQNSVDYDDAFSIVDKDEGIKQLSLYISNVTIWMDVLNLWESFSKRISTIYLPDKKRPMLPTILSDCLCSLQANVRRVAFVMDIFIKDNIIIDTKFCNALICVSNNYVYEEAKLLGDSKYHNILDCVQHLERKSIYNYGVKTSHELVGYLMILMNYHCATELIKFKTGIFRSAIIHRDYPVPDTLPEDVGRFIKMWNSSTGQYINGSEIVNTRHELLDIDAYIHITSPIRRLVDLLNIIQFQRATNIVSLSENAFTFYDKWLSDIDYINVTMRSIRKVQCDCSLLDLCYNNPEIMEKEYDGYLFDRFNRSDGLYQYMVFLPHLKLSARITLREYFENFEAKKFKLYLFSDEEKFKKKIRLHTLI
jgi:hypothetical protein